MRSRSGEPAGGNRAGEQSKRTLCNGTLRLRLVTQDILTRCISVACVICSNGDCATQMGTDGHVCWCSRCAGTHRD